MTAEIIRLPYTHIRRFYSRRPRRSKNGTPDERATTSPQESATKKVRAVAVEPEPLSITGRNARLRLQRREIWRNAQASTDYWHTRFRFEDAVVRVQRCGTPEAGLHAPLEDEDRYKTHWHLVEKYRAAKTRQLLTPAPDVISILWKRTALVDLRAYLTEALRKKIERAIHDDVAFLAAHPTRRHSAKGRTS